MRVASLARWRWALFRECFDQPVLKLQPFEKLLHPDALVLAVGAHVVHVAERAVATLRLSVRATTMMR